MKPSGVSLQTIVPTSKKCRHSHHRERAWVCRIRLLPKTFWTNRCFKSCSHKLTFFWFHGKMCVGGSEVMKRIEKSNCFYICRGQIFYIGSMLWEAVEQKTAENSWPAAHPLEQDKSFLLLTTVLQKNTNLHRYVLLHFSRVLLRQIFSTLHEQADRDTLLVPLIALSQKLHSLILLLSNRLFF